MHRQNLEAIWPAAYRLPSHSCAVPCPIEHCCRSTFISQPLNPSDIPLQIQCHGVWWQAAGRSADYVEQDPAEDSGLDVLHPHRPNAARRLLEVCRLAVAFLINMDGLQISYLFLRVSRMTAHRNEALQRHALHCIKKRWLLSLTYFQRCQVQRASGAVGQGAGSHGPIGNHSGARAVSRCRLGAQPQRQAAARRGTSDTANLKSRNYRVASKNRRGGCQCDALQLAWQQAQGRQCLLIAS